MVLCGSILGNKGTLLGGNCHFMVMNDHFGGPSAIESTELCELVDWHNVLVAHPPAFEEQVANTILYCVRYLVFPISSSFVT